jgi:nitrate reductase beta subunit
VPIFNDLAFKANKCIGCYPRVEKGIATACVAQCVGRAMHVGFLDDPKSSVHKLAKAWKVALPMHPEFGTEPNFFYVPPFLGPAMEDKDGNLSDKPKIPQAELERMFGPRVGEVVGVLRAERAKRMNGQPSELMDILIGTKTTDLMMSPLT